MSMAQNRESADDASNADTRASIVPDIGTVLVIGAGIAGASAVEALRREGYDGRILLLGDEPERPYERPPLSKGYLLGTISEEKVFLRPADFYAEQQVELRTGAHAHALDTAARQVILADGAHIGYDRLLIATGGAARHLSVPGADLHGIHYLRTLADARALANALLIAGERGQRIVVIGAGFIGAEVAADCCERGLDVTLLEVLPVPLARVLGNEVGALYAALHRAHGVDLRLGEGAIAFEGIEGSDHVSAVLTTHGERIPCGLVIAGVGMRPSTDWLRDSGVALGDGVLVDAYCETSVPGIFAAGDVANWPYRPAGAEAPLRVRLEHWDNALRQGEVAARNLLGKQQPFSPVPYFWSDQYDIKLQYVGYAHEWDQVIVRGQPDAGTFTAFYLGAGHLRAALAVNRIRELATLKRLIGAALDPAALADERTDLKSLVPRP